jgi:hypothetical protein
MEGRLYELIRDYQTDRAATVGGRVLEFRTGALRRFALSHPERYPEYILEDGRLSRSIAQARAAGEILPPIAGQRDCLLVLRIDRDRAP